MVFVIYDRQTDYRTGSGNMEENELIKTMLCRASCRSYRQDPIPPDLLQTLLDCALHSASGGNLQPFSVLVIRNPASKELLAGCCRTPFLAQAPVCLMFLLDWNKLAVFTEAESAPFIANRSFDCNLTAFADIMCAAQRVETAAGFCGLASCFIGNVLGQMDALREPFGLPSKTCPVLLMTLGYPKTPLRPQPKLSESVMVFEEKYPSGLEEAVMNGYRERYQNAPDFKLSEEPAARQNQLKQIREALLVSFSDEQTEEIIAAIDHAGKLSNIQWRFTMKYCANLAVSEGETVKQDFVNQDLLW